MGLAWCRERVEQAQNSKSPVDRILVCCFNVIKPKSTYSHSQGKVANDFVYKGMRNKNFEISNPVPIHAVPPRTRSRAHRSSGWQTCTLTVPDAKDFSEPPIPPPRKKRKEKIDSMEVLNNYLPELHSPSYVIYSENLINKKIPSLDSVEKTEADELHPMKKSFSKEKTGGDLFGKFSGYRTRKIKIESHSKNAKEARVKYDNEEKAEEKIKHVSTVSLPNYNELVKPSRKVSADAQNGDDKTGNQSVGLKHPHRNSSTISLPGEGSNSILGSLSEATIHRLETYMKKCRSFGPLKPQQLLEKLEEFNKTNRSASESEDSWSGLDDWDLGVIEYCDSEMTAPLTPKSTLPPREERDKFNDSKQEAGEDENEKEADREEKASTDRTPNIQRFDSVIEGVPIEWFFYPSLRLPMIMPPPEVESSKTPPPSPENEAGVQKTMEGGDDHSPLLNILRQYKDAESDEPEVDMDENEIENVLTKDPLTFDEIDVKIPPSETLSPILRTRYSANTVTDEEEMLMQERAKRSSSIGYENSAHLLKKLESNKEEIEKEIFFKPGKLIQRLRRKSLCESLPEDAFEAYLKKKKPLRESLNNFLGFQDQKKPNHPDDDEKPEKASGEKIKSLNGGKDENEEEKLPPPPPPPLPPPLFKPPPIVINPPQGEENTPVPYSLVKSDNNLNIF